MTKRPRSKGKPPLAAQPTSAEPTALPIDPSADPAETTLTVLPETAAAVVPAHFPIVGIGASAGGLSAFEAFFAGMPAQQDPGMAFVRVQHLAPDFKSILSELIRHYTRMLVLEVALTRLARAEILQPSLTQRLTHSGAVLVVGITATALLNASGEIYAIATTERHVKGGER